MPQAAGDTVEPDPRPFGARLLHTVAEVLASFALAGGMFVGLVAILCHGHTGCEDFRGLAYHLFSLIVTALVWCLLIVLLIRYRDRPRARALVDVLVLAATVGFWLAYLKL